MFGIVVNLGVDFCSQSKKRFGKYLFVTEATQDVPRRAPYVEAWSIW